MIDVSPLTTCDVPYVSSLMNLISLSDGAPIPIEVFLSKLTGCRKSLWLMRQLVFWIANTIDGAVLQDADAPSAAELPPQPADAVANDDIVDAEDSADGQAEEFLKTSRQTQAAWRKLKNAQALRIKSNLDVPDEMKCLRYYFASRRMFKGSKVMHLACDVAISGETNRMLGFISKPGNYGGWAPPVELWVRGAGRCVGAG